MWAARSNDNCCAGPLPTRPTWCETGIWLARTHPTVSVTAVELLGGQRVRHSDGRPGTGVLSWSNGADIDAELLRYDDQWNEALPGVSPA
jgi:hypothetical protein